MSNLTESLERFRRGPELLAMVLTGVYGDETDFSLAPGKWSIRLLIAHLADSEMVGAQRFRQVIAEDNPPLGAFDQDAWARNLDYARKQPKQSLESFRRVRAENYELLKSLPESAFERTGMHSERGAQARGHIRLLPAGEIQVTRDCRAEVEPGTGAQRRRRTAHAGRRRQHRHARRPGGVCGSAAGLCRLRADGAGDEVRRSGGARCARQDRGGCEARPVHHSRAPQMAFSVRGATRRSSGARWRGGRRRQSEAQSS